MVEFSSQEIELLRDLLQHHLGELEIEVFRTDTHDFKEKLKHRREVVEGILKRMPEPAAIL
jgi:hypothetical protein